MKIGIDTRLWNETGVGRYIRNLTIELSKIDKTNDYVLFARSQDLSSIKSSITNSKFQTINANVPWHSLAEQYKFLKIINEQNLGLMHFTYYSHPIRYKMPYVVTIHDLIIYHFATGKASTKNPIFYHLKRQAYKRIIKTSAKNAQKIIVPSNYVKKDAAETLKVKSEKVVVTYEGVDSLDSKFMTNNSKVKNVPDGKFFMYVGNAYPHKNLEALLEAFSNFENKETSLLLVGPDDFFYKRLKKDLPNNCTVLHNVSDEELEHLYKKAVALIHPSLAEGFGLTLLEAMSKDCPVIASDIPVLKEVCRDHAIYFDPKNADSISEKMDYMYNLDQSEREKITQSAKKYANGYTWKKTASETLTVYESCNSLRQSK